MEPVPSKDPLPERRNALKEQFDILTRELARLRTEAASVAGGARRFELEQMISSKEEERTHIEEEIAALDEERNDGN